VALDPSTRIRPQPLDEGELLPSFVETLLHPLETDVQILLSESFGCKKVGIGLYGSYACHREEARFTLTTRAIIGVATTAVPNNATVAPDAPRLRAP